MLGATTQDARPAVFDVHQIPAFTFPPGFLLGSGAASYQIEGGNRHSYLWRDEQAGKYWVDNPRITHPSGATIDFRNRWQADVDLVAALGHRAWRISLEWSRIEPEEGCFDESEIDWYRQVLERLQAHGISIFLTLTHISLPKWFMDKGGFDRRENIPAFERYAAKVVPRLSDLVSWWNVLNEFNGGRFTRDGLSKFANLRAHAAGYHTIKRWSKAPVSSAHALTHWMPRRAEDPFDRAACVLLDQLTNGFFFHAIRTGELVCPYTDSESAPEVKGTCDFWAVNYYTRTLADARRSNPGDGAKPTFLRTRCLPFEGFYTEEWYPEGLVHELDRLRDRPVLITENGLASADDRLRIAYLTLHLAAVAEAIARGVDVRGYLYWTTFDNYEWYSKAPRFGMVHVDFTTQVRTPKSSAAFYREVIAAHGCSPELLARHLPSSPSMADADGQKALAEARCSDVAHV